MKLEQGVVPDATGPARTLLAAVALTLAAFTGGLAGAGGGYSSTPQGKVIVTAFADSYNQMVTALRNYKAQPVKSGLGTGGRLGVSGGSTAASKEADATAAAKKK